LSENLRDVKRKLNVMVKWQPAMTVTRVSVSRHKLCYVVKANRVVPYRKGRSRIVYIGTTKRGITRLASSAATRAPAILARHGITSFDVHVVTSTPRQHIKTWWKLERALLLTFRDLYGVVPLFNSHGKKMRERDEFGYFAKARLKHVIEDLG